MKTKLTLTAAIAAASIYHANGADAGETHLYMDVHELGSVSASAVADAHAKDLTVQEKYGVNFIRYWVDEANGRVYCLAEAPTPQSISAAHAEAHGLVPKDVHEVANGLEARATGRMKLFMDVHEVGAGKVTADDVAAAHEKDLAVQDRHGVNFINYWVDPRSGDIFCLSEAENAEAVLATHREAHGLVSDAIAEVIQGQ